MALTDLRRPADTLAITPSPAPVGAGARDARDSARPADRKTARDPWLDNARLFAAVLIVVSHFLIQVVERSQLAELAWTSTWAFRLPVYVVVAGLFSSAAPLDRRRGTTLLRNVLFVYLVFEVIQTAQLRLSGVSVSYDPFEPEFGLWFLLSLFCWRVALPWVARIPHLAWWAVAAAVGAGFLPSIGTTFSLSRTLALFPLFVLGWKLQDADLRARLGTVRVRLVAAGLATALTLGLGLLGRTDELRLGEFVMKAGYPGDLLNQAADALARLGLLAAAALGAFTVLSLMPRRRLPVITALGAGSMYIYLLHLLVVQQLVLGGYFRSVDGHLELAVMVLGATALALVLASPPVRRVMRPLVQPRSFPSVRALVPAGLRRGRVV